jgi:peptidoglycan/xylan/chitin deacetylase (PgdA/CDA1 family)
MMRYLVKTPWLLQKIYNSRVWHMPGREKNLYLSFDDGPHPVATAFVLDQLKQYEAKASFFCIGNNVQSYPDIYKRIINEGHVVGNHGQRHLSGYSTKDDEYVRDVEEASRVIKSSLFRPPYGRLRSSQAKKLPGYKIIMWSVLSGDFDAGINEEKCWQNVLRNLSPGAIIVFHDSEKALSRLRYTLPKVLEMGKAEGYDFKGIVLGNETSINS